MAIPQDNVPLTGNEFIEIKNSLQTFEVPFKRAALAGEQKSSYLGADYNAVFLGDSLTAGYPSNYVTGAGTVTGNVYPAIALNQLNANGTNWTGVNLGVPGKFATAMLADAPVQAAANYVPGKVNLVVILAGINDVSVMPVDGDPNTFGAGIAATIASLCNAWRTYVGSDGGNYKVIVVTLPATAFTYKDAARAAANAIIRANYTRYADACADIGADPALGAINASQDARWFQGDTIHPTLAGYARMGQIIAPYIYGARLGALFRPQTVPDGVALPRLTGFQGLIGDPNNTAAPSVPLVSVGASNYIDISLNNLTRGTAFYAIEVVGIDWDGFNNLRQRRFLVRATPGEGVTVATLEDNIIGGTNPTTWTFAFSPDTASIRLSFAVAGNGNVAFVRYTVLDRLRVP